MRITAVLLALISFVGLAVFGVYGMINHGHNNGFAACLASLTQNGFCPQANAFASADFHINSFKFFSNAPLGNISAVLAFLAILLTAGSLIIGLAAPAELTAVGIARHRLNETFTNSLQPFKKEKIFWSALHENSPTQADISFRSSISA